MALLKKQAQSVIVYDVKTYGATGDNATDDTAAVQSAIDAMPATGATLYFPPGTYRINSAALDSIPSGSVVMGAGRGASWIRSTTGTHNLFEFEDGKLYLTFKSLKFSMHATGGHIFAPLGTFSQGYFQDVWTVQGNPAKSIWKQLDYGYYYNSWRDAYCFHDGATSVPAFDFTSATTAVFNANSFSRLTLEATSIHASYFFDFDTTSASEQLYTNYFTDITTEILNGGVVRARGANGFVFRNVDMYDFTTTVNSLFYIGKGTTGNITSRNNTFENINRVGGTLGGGTYDIELESSKATDTTFINVIKSTNSGCVVELNSNANAVIIGCRGTTFNNRVAVLSNTPQWVKVTKAYTDFSTAGVTNDISIYTLQAKEYISDVKIIPTTAFSGGTIATYTISVGIAGLLTKYAIATNVFTGNTTLGAVHTPLIGLESISTTTDIRAQAVSTVGNLNAATAGSVDIYLLVATLPS